IADFARSWSENQRRQVLRPHWEDRSGITDSEEINLREQFDGVMEWLLALELAGSTGYLDLEETTARVTSDMRLLLATSPAVAHFIDDYDYFGVCFLASRLDIALHGLPPLPAPTPVPAEHGVIETFLNKEMALRADSDVQAFLNVLDDFIKPLPSPNGRTDEVGARQFRRWLRGKDMQFGQPAEDFCHALACGAIRWCIDKAQLYNGCNLIIQTRLGVFDFYWLMKLFGAEVSTSGIVTYKYPAWFDDLCCYAASPVETKALIEAREIFFQAGSLA